MLSASGIRFAAVVVALGVAVAACSHDIQPFVAPPDESYPAEQVERGENVHLRVCANCHGREGGGGVGPNIRQVWERLTPEEHLAVAVNGRQRMPGFGSSIEPDDLAAVVAYQRIGWSDPES